jgi:hypothetical protein
MRFIADTMSLNFDKMTLLHLGRELTVIHPVDSIAKEDPAGSRPVGIRTLSYEIDRIGILISFDRDVEIHVAMQRNQKYRVTIKALGGR